MATHSLNHQSKRKQQDSLKEQVKEYIEAREQNNSTFLIVGAKSREAKIVDELAIEFGDKKSDRQNGRNFYEYRDGQKHGYLNRRYSGRIIAKLSKLQELKRREESNLSNEANRRESDCLKRKLRKQLIKLRGVKEMVSLPDEVEVILLDDLKLDIIHLNNPPCNTSETKREPATNQPDQEPPSNPPDLKTPTSETKGEPPTNQPDQEPQVQEKIEVTINKINYEIEHDPDINQLNELKSQANSEAWNKLIGWVSEWILSRVKSYVNRAITPFKELLLDMDLKEAKRQVEELKSKFPDYPPDEIAKILIGQTCLEVAGISLQESLKAQAYVKEIDSQIEIAISMIARRNLKTITNECAEMVYKIAMIYGFDMDNPIRIFEVLAAFGIAWLGNRAIDAGIGLLEDIGLLQVGFYGETTIRAGSKALMILTVGYAARQFYREKLKANELLKNQTAFKWVVKSSQNSELYNIRNDEDLPTIIRQNIMPQSPTLNTPKHKTPDPKHKTPEQKKPPEPKTEREPKININRDAENLSIKSPRGMDYSQLENLLKCGEWKASDKETRRIMLKLVKREKWNWFDDESIRCLPGEHLSYIDYLWKSNSGDRFGFSVQKSIYNALEGTGEYDAEIWSKFATKIGWKREENWLFYCDLQFDVNAPKGHLPAVLGHQMRLWGLGDVYGSRLRLLLTRDCL